MPDPNQLAQDFLNALASSNPPEFERILHPDVGIRVWSWDKVTVHRPRSRVVQHLMQEWSTWSYAMLEKLSVIADNERIAVEFRIQATEMARRTFMVGCR